MIAVALLKVLIVVTATIMAVVAFMLGRKAGHREGQVKTLDQLRKDLDETIVEWGKRSAAGEMARSIELPGIHAVRNMLGSKLRLL